MRVSLWIATAAIGCCVIALAIDRASSQVGGRPTPVQQAPGQPSAPIALVKDDPAEWFVKAQDALGKKVDADFDDISLDTFADWIAKSAQLDIAIDRRALRDAGVKLESKITLHCKSTPLSDVVEQGLTPLQLSIAATPSASGLRITTVESANLAVFVRSYDVRDLALYRDREGATVHDADEVVAIVSQYLHQQTWNNVGGAGGAAIFADTLVVSQTWQMHQRVAAALQRIREVRDEQLKGELSPKPLDPADDANLAAMAQLKKRCVLHVKDKPLGDFAAFAAKELKATIRVDERALKDAGIERTTPISIQSEHGTWDAALRAALRDVDLTIVGRNGVVTITSRDAADNEQITMLYPVADLIDSLAQGNEPGEGWDSLSELITSFVSPQSWSTSGPGNVYPCLPSQAAIIPQSYEGHAQIQSLLAQLRRHVQARSKDMPAEDPVETQVYRIPKDVTPDAAQATAEGIAKIIRETIAPESWKAGDVNAAYLRVLPDRILVRNRRSVQREVVKLLTSIDGLATSVVP